MSRFLSSIFLTILILWGANLPLAACQSEPDDIVNYILKYEVLEKPQTNTSYNFEDTDTVEIKLVINSPISSEYETFEGEKVLFKTLSDVYYGKNLIIKKDTIIPARVETIISSGMNGIPASIIFGNFEFENISKKQITDSFEIKGQDRSLWVFPLKWALTPLPPTGSLTNFIKGGHVKVNKHDIVKLYYHPNW